MLEIRIVAVEMIKASLKVTVAMEITWIVWVASVAKIWIQLWIIEMVVISTKIVVFPFLARNVFS